MTDMLLLSRLQKRIFVIAQWQIWSNDKNTEQPNCWGRKQLI